MAVDPLYTHPSASLPVTVNSRGLGSVVVNGGVVNPTDAVQRQLLQEARVSSATPLFADTPFAPAISSVTPDGGFDTGATFVTIHGAAFTGATAVKFGGTSVGAFFNVVDDSTITCLSPAHAAANNQQVEVTTPLGVSADTPADDYDFYPELIVNDNFVDTEGTLIESHTADLGGPWIKQSGSSASSGRVRANRAAFSAGSSAIYFAGALPRDIQRQRAEGTIRVMSRLGSAAIAIRTNGGNTTYAIAGLIFTSGTTQAFFDTRYNGGTFTVNYLQPIADQGTGGDHDFALQCEGNHYKFWVDGVMVWEGDDNTIPLTEGERSAIWLSGGTTSTGYHIEDIQGKNLPAP